MSKEVLKIRRYKAGYEIRVEKWMGTDYGIPEGEHLIIRSAYSPDGAYIGDPRMAYRLTKRGIAPELRTDHSKTCSIGFCKREQKWYGWSHRGICGFGIGDRLFEELFEGADDHTPFVAHGSKTIETVDEARQAASNFAEYVS